jgi:15-cis-phytoene synthase
MAGAPLSALREVALAREPDRYFAATLAPEAIRYDLIVLAAFAAELANIPAQVRESLAGEIRLQWWRDALASEGGDVAAGNPVATAMRATIARYALPTETLNGVIDSYADVLHGEGPADEDALGARMAAGEGGLFRLAARICGADGTGSLNNATRAAGLAYGLSRSLRRFPAEGAAHLPVPRTLISDHDLIRGTENNPSLTAAVQALSGLALSALSDIAPQFAKMSRAKRLAYLPLAMVRPNLRALETWSKRRGAASIEPLLVSRLLHITWAHVSGRF